MMAKSEQEAGNGRSVLVLASLLLLAFSLTLLVTNILPTRRRLDQLESVGRALREENERLRQSTLLLDAQADAARDDPYFQERLYRKTYRYRADGEKVIYFAEDETDEMDGSAAD